jgi:hypothetical protein
MDEGPQLGRLFIDYGCQYYVVGRFSAFAGLTPIVGNVIHHAIEMLLKGALTTSMTLAEMKGRLGHRLLDMWDAFKTQSGEASLSAFDATIATLNAFEDIRYPEKLFALGGLLQIDITKAGKAQTTGSSSGSLGPKYELCIEEIDELVDAIFKASRINSSPFFGWIMPEAKRFTFEDNSFFKA